jgi:predicted DNA-binding ribbon-helix-helix protein
MAIEPFFWAQPTPRIVQYKKKRYALRLENIFWEELEFLARRRGRRLGQLIAELDEAHQGPNLSSFVRGFCMVEAERDASRFRLESGSFDLLDILRGSPAPALLLTHDRLIIDANPALMEWAGPEITYRKQKFDSLFVPRVTRSLDETIELMRSGQLKRTQIQVTHAGRTVPATLTALSVGSIFYCLVWLSVPSQSVRIVAR